MKQTQTDKDLADWLTFSKEIENDVKLLKRQLTAIITNETLTPEKFLEMHQELRCLNRLAKIVWRNIFHAQKNRIRPGRNQYFAHKV